MIHGAARRIDGRPDSRDGAGVLDLKAIQGVLPIGDLAKAQMLVRIGDDLRQGGHGRDSE